MAADASFADKLTLILKALSISRGRLAAEVGVDKSVAGRWSSGAVLPSAINLEGLTRFVASRSPGFTMLDWDGPIEAIAERFGVAVPAAAPIASPTGIGDWFPLPLLNEAAATVRIRGADYEGIWRTTRPSSEIKGQFIHDHVLIRKAPNGMLSYTLGIFDIRFNGWALPLQHQLFSIATDAVTGTFVFAIFNGVARQKAEVLDGLIMTCMRDAGGTPVASKCLLTRVADLTGDELADNEAFDTRALAHPLSAPDAIAPHIRDHLWHETGPASFAAGGDPMLMMAFARSMSRGPGFEDSRPV